jgi:hypothetical protein
LVKKLFWFLMMLQSLAGYARQADSSRRLPDTAGVQPHPDTAAVQTAADSLVKPSVINTASPQFFTPDHLLSNNKILNSKSTPDSIAVKYKIPEKNEAIFYLLAGLLVFLGCIKIFYSRYFTNLFRVFFNTSLRQSQLTDQLLQAKLPSLLFNVLFVLSGGVYVYLLLLHERWIQPGNLWMLVASSVGVLALIYLLKYCTLKFTGWITGYGEQTNIYVFITFLINKIIGIILLPFAVLIAFSSLEIAGIAVILSLLIIGLMLLLRFFRSYGLLQNQLKVTRFHFFLYILGIEILPLLLIYKGLVFLLSKNQ